jgi:RNA-directed DNA polymerase
LRRQGSAEAILPCPSTRKGPNIEKDGNLSTARDEQKRQKITPKRGEPNLAAAREARQGQVSAEASPGVNERTSDGGGQGVWGRVFARANLFQALERVEKNGGAPGVDGMTVDELRPYLHAHWLDIRARLDAGRYIPQPVRRVAIPKPDGNGERLLGIPTVVDRLIQQAVAQVLTPLFEPGFSSQSYGFRPGRKAHDAVVCAQGYIREGYTWVVDLDLEKFFDWAS